MAKDSIERAAGSSGLLSGGWFDPIETAIRDRVRGFIEDLMAGELDEAPGRTRDDAPRRRMGFRATGTGGGSASCSAHSVR